MPRQRLATDEWPRTCSDPGMPSLPMPFHTAARMRASVARPPARCAGFSLLETVIAVALLAAVMMSLAGGISQSIHHDAVAHGSTAAFLLANQQIEAIRNQVQAN